MVFGVVDAVLTTVKITFRRKAAIIRFLPAAAKTPDFTFGGGISFVNSKQILSIKSACTDNIPTFVHTSSTDAFATSFWGCRLKIQESGLFQGPKHNLGRNIIGKF
jgi:hypothetical protein